MKKTLKIVLPILLIFSLLVVGYWFFFQYRVDLTTSFLRNVAESQMESGHYSMAIRCYRWANDLNPQDAELAMKLAEAYRQSGNYTKTENVLVHAIYDAPGDARLYEALSRAYVDQDKLLDAQRMLDTISNPDVMAELSGLRPAAPVLTPEGAFYSDYISVEASCPDADANCYLTFDGRYPSLQTDAYAGPIQLPAGETTICALAVNDAGLVSSAVYAGYTVAGVVEDVTFHDRVLESAIQEMLHRGHRTIRTNDLWDIEELTLPEGMTDTQDLRYFPGVQKLIARDMGELDYSFLSSMPELRYLELEHCAVSTENLEQIAASCPRLDVLILANCGLSKINPLGELTGLRVLDLSENSIGTIDSLMTLAALDELYLGHNALTRIPVMRGLRSIRILDLSYNSLSYANGVSACTTLQRLNLSHNMLSSLTPLSALTELVWLNCSNNALTDTTPLTPCTKLEGVVLSYNKLTEVDFLAGCPAIREVDIDYNDVVSAPEFQKDCPLETFSAAHNFLEGLNGLSDLQKLTVVYADYNNVRDLSPLLSCPALVQVDVYNTNVRSGGELAEKGVVVNFTPGF